MLYSRDILSQIKKVLDRDEFIILTGARQTGKTSLLIILKEFLEEKGKICHYFNLENPENLELLNKHPYNIFEIIPEKKSKQYIFIDEIQYLNNPSNFLKLLFDEKREKVKIITSGSSAFYIDKKFKDSLVGRKFLFEIYPLNFNEFLIFRNQDDLIKKNKQKLSKYYQEKVIDLWTNYLIYGGYPKVVLAENSEMQKIILEDIANSYIKKDIRDAGIKQGEKYFALLKILAGQTGNLVNSQELAATLQTAHKTIEEYLYVMQKSYQIAFIKPFYKNLRKELTKMPKVYFYDLGLRNLLLNNFNQISKRQDRGAYLENIAFREFLNQAHNLDSIKFWRTQDKKEIDFIVDNQAFEIKLKSDKIKKGRYAQFVNSYPDIKLNFLSYEQILEKFYGYKIINTPRHLFA